MRSCFPRIAFCLFGWVALLLCSLSVGTALLFGQEAPRPREPAAYSVDIWTTEDGLPQNWVYALAQTDDGYLWVGTGSGLARFNGLTFEVFDQSNTEALRSNEIRALYKDAAGALWISTGIDDAVLRYRHGRFERFTPDDGVLFPTIIDFYEEADSTLWLRLQTGLVRYRAGRFTAFPRVQWPDPLPTVPASDIEEGFLFMYGTVLRWASDGIPRQVVTEKGRTLSGDDLVLRDRHGALWFKRAESLWRYVPGVPAPEKLLDRSVSLLFEDRAGTLWVGLERGGLLRWNGQAFVQELALNTTATRMFEDREGTLWLGTTGDGLVRITAPSKFTTLTPRDGLPDELAWTVLDARDGTRWIGTDGGLSRYRDGRYTTFTTADGLPHNRVFSLYEDPDGTLWVGTQRGLVHYDGRRFTAYPVEAPPDVRANSPAVRGAIYRDRRGTLWVGHSAGLSRVVGEVLSVVALTTPEGFAPPVRVRGIHEARDGTLWFGTERYGLLRYRDDQFRFFTSADGLPHHFVQSFYEEPDGTLWVTTRGGGLVRYRNDAFQVITPEQGLFDGTVHYILEDDRGFFWMGSNRGVFRVHKDQLHAVADGRAGFVTSVAYGRADGLLSVECNTGNPGATRTADGRLWFPTMKGFAVIDPNNIPTNEVPPPVVLERLLVDYEPVPLAEDLRLPPGTRGLAFEYTGLSFVAPEKVRFKYRLDGYDRDWVDAGARRTAFYTNIGPGRYTFRVQAANNDGVWNEAGASLAFVVRSHFYETPWFYALTVLGLFALGFLRFRYRLRKMREQELVALVEERTAGLMAAKKKTEAQAQKLDEQARQLIELDQMKTRFFANISHEFRTPLTLTLGPLEDILNDPNDPYRADHERMHRNARRLLHLINELLDISKLEAGKMTLRAHEQDLIRFTRRLVQAFSSMAERRQITLGFKADVDALLVSFDADKLEKVFYNLLSNAFKYTGEGGKILVTVSKETADDGAVAVLTVADTGQGIPHDELPYVFDRFYQTDDPTRRRQASTGIGLALAKELMALHNGTIAAESEPGFGSTFMVRLPLGTAPLQPDDLAEEGRAGEGEAVAVDYDTVDDPSLPYPHTPIPPHANEDAPTVLIVEDNADMRGYLREQLDPHYAVLEAADGLDGLDTAREVVPDLVLSDVMMPEMDGFALCRALKTDARTSHIPVILLTARASGKSKIEGLETGADDYLAKPFNTRELRARIDNLIESRRQLRQRFSRAPVLHPTEVAVTSADEVFLTQAMALVEDHLAEGSFGVFELAEVLGMSRRQLHRKLTALTDEGPSEFIRRVRLHRAKHLLDQGYGTIAEVAYAVGFNKPAYFSEVFRKTFGQTPTEYLG